MQSESPTPVELAPWPGRDTRISRMDTFLWLLTLSCCFVLSTSAALRPTYSYDAFWLLQMGQDWLNGLDPGVDRHSFSHYGQPLSSVYLGTPVALALLVQWMGVDAGFSLYVTVSMLLTVAFLAFTAWRSRAPAWAALLGLVFATYFLELRAFVRPELLTYPLLVLLAYLCDRARSQLNWQAATAIAALLIISVNYHNPVIAYLVTFGLFVDRAAYLRRTKAAASGWLAWLSFGIIALLIGFLKPGDEHFLLGVLHFDPIWRELIQEYRPVPEVYSGAPLVYCFFAGAWALVLLLLWNRDYGQAIIVGVLAVQSWEVARLLTPAAVVTVAIALIRARSLCRLLEGRAVVTAIRPSVATALVAALAAFGLHASTAQVMLLHDHKRISYGERRYGTDVVAYLREHATGGRILNQFKLGGYLINTLPEEFAVYIDGRTNMLYSADFYRSYVEAVSDPQRIAALVDTYDVDFAIFESTQPNYRLLVASKRLDPEYVGSGFMLFSRRGLGFPLTSQLIFEPYCLRQLMDRGLSSEVARGETLLSEGSLSRRVQSQLAHLEGPRAATPAEDDAEARVAAYIALARDRPSEAIAILESINAKQNLDVLVMALAMALSDNAERARSLVEYWSRINGEIVLSLPEAIVLDGLVNELWHDLPLSPALESIKASRLARTGENAHVALPWRACSAHAGAVAPD